MFLRLVLLFFFFPTLANAFVVVYDTSSPVADGYRIEAIGPISTESYSKNPDFVIRVISDGDLPVYRGSLFYSEAVYFSTTTAKIELLPDAALSFSENNIELDNKIANIIRLKMGVKNLLEILNTEINPDVINWIHNSTSAFRKRIQEIEQ